MTTTIEIQCRDPIVSRDGRPFGANSGNRMAHVPWPLPSVIAGSLRTALAKEADKPFSAATIDDLLGLSIAGGLPVYRDTLYLPAPQDCAVTDQKQVVRLRPEVDSRGGCDWPHSGLLPVAISRDSNVGPSKPRPAPAWWPIDRYAAWLAGGESVEFDSGFLLLPEAEWRTHVQILPQSGAAEEGRLFSTVALPLTHLPRFQAEAKTFGRRFAEIRLAVRVCAADWCGETLSRFDTWHPFGGERRLAHWRKTDSGCWDCPSAVASALDAAKQVRMVLASPAIFSDGWKPGWLNDQLEGEPPATDVRLKLVAVSIERWRAVSGWSLVSHGPKKVRRMVPAGGVYFFQVLAGRPGDLGKHWLESVSDDEQERRDGFGLATWGVW